ncbi:MAG: hypothetical protein WCW67_05135 [Candidatus Margulisiibacteriota bacterium]|jgi:hydrogenase-4 component E
MTTFILYGILLTAFALVAAKRFSALIGIFRLQAVFLAALAFLEAWKGGGIGIYVIAVLLLVVKGGVIPYLLVKILKEIGASEDLGFFLSAQLSLLLAVIFAYLAWQFSGQLFPGGVVLLKVAGTAAFTLLLVGLQIMIFRLKALAQIIGLLVMENGIFLLGIALAGGLPFLVEIAVFLDVFVSVMILGVFVYRINRLFTSIDVSRLNRLKG